MSESKTQPIRAIEALKPGVHQIAPRLYLKVVKRKKGLSRHVLLRWHNGTCAESKSLGPWQPRLYGHFLAEAERAAEARTQDRDVRLVVEETGTPGSYKEAAELYMAENLPAFRSDKHRKRWRRLMESTYPVLGHLKITQLEPAHMGKVLRDDWQRTPVQIMRVRAMIEQVIDFGIARANLNIRNVAARGLVKHLLPRRPRRQVKSMRAMAYDDVPALHRALASDGHVSSVALMFALLTVTRSTETRVMTWAEVDLEKALWTIPPGRTKMFKSHRVPLSAPALAILRRVRALNLEGDYVFPGRTRGKAYSHNMLLNAIKRVGFHEAGTPHGLRSTFKDWCRETQDFKWEAVEFCLAHEVGSDVERDYAHADLLNLRRPIMDAWGHFVTSEPVAPELSTEILRQADMAPAAQAPLPKGRVLRLVASA
jgi:integrase